MKRLLSLVLAALALPAYLARPADWQWSVAINGARDKAGPARAFLWIPPTCQKVRGVVFAQHNMEEISILEHPKFRQAVTELNFAEIWCGPAFDLLFRFNEGAGDTLNRLIEDLANESGYAELKFAPIAGLGHSAAASSPYYIAAWNPERTLAAISVSGQWPYVRNSFAPDIWGNRNVDFIPGLETMGEYEAADTWSAEGLKERQQHPILPLSMLACPAEGHFATSDKKVDYLALYLKKAAQYRLPEKWPDGASPKLKALDPRKTGWLADKWRLDKPPAAPAAPVAEYKGDPQEAFWYFDEEIANATEKYGAAYRGLKPQLVGFVQSDKLVPQTDSHLQVTPKFELQADGVTFKLEAGFYDTVPGGSPRPARWTRLPVSSPIGHAAGGGPIIIERICGPFEKLSPDTFAVRLQKETTGREERYELVLAATHPGDKDYKAAVQQAHIFIPARNTTGKDQQITFEPVPDQKAGTKSLKLNATSDAGEKVYYYIREGPAEIDGDTLRFTPIPPRARFPVKVTVIAWQYGRSSEPKLKTAVPVERTFRIIIPESVPLKAHPFPLTDVRLLDGPFTRAMNLDGKYLLDLEPDRLLHNFRLNAGLPSTAEPLGNWEAPRSELRGHLTGHYLSACAMMYASSGDERFRERAVLLVRELGKCQAALGTNGYLSAFPESFFDRLEAGTKVWAPYYTLHKVLAGLLDAHSFCADPQALALAVKLGNWVTARTDRLSDDQVEQMLAVEHGGINEAMANLYAVTGDERFLRTARRLCHQRVLNPLAVGQDKLAGLHANTQFPKVIGAARLYELTGDERYHKLAEFFWDRVVNHHSYVMGGNSDHEGFGSPDKLSGRVSPFTAESCNTYNMLKLTRHLFAWDAAAPQADYYERALYNHILASQDPRTGMMAYHIPVYGGWFMPYNTTNDSAWCCTGSGFENHAKYGDSIYWHDSDAIFVNLFIPSELTWREKSVTLRQETRYPEEDTTRLELHCPRPCEMTLHIRYPAWARRGIDIKVNGKSFQQTASPGSFVSVSRTWNDGDRIEVKLPMSLRLEPMPDNPTRAAICYGPVVLAGELGTDEIKPPMPYAIKQSDFFKVKQPAMPLLLAGGRAVGDWVEPVTGKPLTFRTRGVGQPRDVTLVAFYALPPQRYSLYWDILTPVQWKQRIAADELRARRDRELSARTLDFVDLGDSGSEKAHNLKKGEGASAGTFSNRFYRAAGNGGWFSYDLKFPSGQPIKLLCTYWGSDAGQRAFDLLVNDTRIATQKLNHNQPGEFFDVEYDLPKELLAAQSQITVRFQAHPGQIAGGLYDLRVVKADSN